MMDFARQLAQYKPFNQQEEKDKELILSLLKEKGDALFERSNAYAHMTACAWVVNLQRDKILLCYHNLFDSWSWLGGHADGERDLLKVALKEVEEESGCLARPLSEQIFSVESLTVDGHEKNGSYVSSHLHLNATYLLEADDLLPIRCKIDENSAVGWFGIEEIYAISTEPWFVKRIYRKLNTRLAMFIDQEKRR